MGCCRFSLPETPEVEELVTMKCRFVKRETFRANPLLASFGTREKLLRGLPENLCLYFLLMFTPYEIFLPLQKHRFGRGGRVCIPAFPWDIWAGSAPRASLSRPEQPVGRRDRAERLLRLSGRCLTGDGGGEGTAVNLIKGSRRRGSRRQAGY